MRQGDARDRDRRGAATGREEGDRPRRARRESRGDLTAEAAARLAAADVEEMTGREPESITSLERTDQGLWQVDVEVVETRRIPDSTDILATYRVELDPEGELVAYRRVQRYSRCQVGER
ncbi:gas vesicle protein GvpO [Actinomadura scrupuli]|uniref:gas vesicle protein GvpO n=1 Tax=Actinomadura scrupuli TaxID=559629 RepID=UPI003D95EE57